MLLSLVLYATVGVMSFGGLFSRDNSLLIGSSFANGGYWAWNFNDFTGSLIIDYILMMVNNWYVFQDAAVIVTQSQWVRLYFVSFHIAIVFIVLNLITSIIMDTFLAGILYANVICYLYAKCTHTRVLC